MYVVVVVAVDDVAVVVVVRDAAVVAVVHVSVLVSAPSLPAPRAAMPVRARIARQLASPSPVDGVAKTV